MCSTNGLATAHNPTQQQTAQTSTIFTVNMLSPFHGSFRNTCAKPENVFGRKSAGRAKARRAERAALWFHGFGCMLPCNALYRPVYSFGKACSPVLQALCICWVQRLTLCIRGCCVKSKADLASAVRQSWSSDRAELATSRVRTGRRGSPMEGLSKEWHVRSSIDLRVQSLLKAMPSSRPRRSVRTRRSKCV